MNTITRWEPPRGGTSLQDQVNRLFEDRSCGAFSLPNTVKTEGVRAEYRNGALTVRMSKREESKAKQVKINVSGNGK